MIASSAAGESARIASCWWGVSGGCGISSPAVTVCVMKLGCGFWKRPVGTKPVSLWKTQFFHRKKVNLDNHDLACNTGR
jgi:hypothetical protein